MLRTNIIRSLVVLSPLWLAACAGTVPSSIVTQPTVVRPVAQAKPLASNGGIFQAANGRNLFEDRQPRQIGDNITVQLEERVTASSQAANNAQRNGTQSTEVKADGTSGTFRRLLGGLSLDLTHDNQFAGQGQTSASNSFNGLITVSVTDILQNGNLVIAGEKQVNIRGEVSFVRVSGVVNPGDIRAGNVVSSTRIAEARIEEMGSGTVASATRAGWLQNLFLSFLPF